MNRNTTHSVDNGKMMKKILMCLVLSSLTVQTFAQSPTPLSPNWFVSLYQSATENKHNVWRGEVLSQNNTTLIVKNAVSGKEVSVTLLHLTYPKNATSKQVNYSNRILSELVGKQVYVLASDSSNSVNAKILDYVGTDLNLQFISNGFFDLNETTLFGKKEKQQYLNALSYAKSAKKGIWN